MQKKYNGTLNDNIFIQFLILDNDRKKQLNFKPNLRL